MKPFTALLASLLVGLSSALEWWEHGNFYQIYPRSFKDTDGDGVGDLEGVTQNLNYLKDLGMDGIWLSPIFQSPMVDFGYDISDFYAIQKEYGDMDAFERLSGACKKLGIRLILDFVPNHTSNKHKLFELSENGDPDYKDYYVWHPGVEGPNGTKLPPSNWLSYFRGSAWEWSEKRKEFYLHQFTKEQPELNFRNPAVGEEMKKILRFWLNKGVAGFRIDAVPHIFESEEFEGRYRDEPESKITNDSQSPAFLTHTQTMDQPETFDLIYEWRAVLDEFTRQDNETRIIMIEGYTTMPKVVKFFGTSENKGAQIPFNFQLISNLHKSSNAVDFAKYAHVWLDEPKPAGSRSNWLLGNHDNSRMATRFGENKIDLYNIALQTLPDIAVTYYGEEIGMMDQWIPYNLSVDPSGLNAGPEDYALYTRDPVRTPMQWNADMSAGFSKNDTTWLPVADNYKTVNVAAQNRAKKSHLRTFKKLTKYRKRRILTEGDLDMRVINDNLLVYKRKVDRVGYVVVALNFGTEPQTLQLSNVYGEIDHKMQVVASSKMVKTQDNAWVDTDSYQLAGESAIVLQYLWGKNPIVESS